mmetsp:Transcript_3233/g.8992  ORF Transcript_3233/g.8992 Transcript_3233/m.8992 type:complete len:134 (+) Transcript_3233:470-871(+)
MSMRYEMPPRCGNVPLQCLTTPLPFFLCLSHERTTSSLLSPTFNQIRRLIDDIRLVRFDKIEKQFKQVTSAMTIRLTNFCAMELNLMRNFLLSSLDEYYKFSTAEESGDVQQQRQTQEMDEDESQDFQVRQLR